MPYAITPIIGIDLTQVGAPDSPGISTAASKKIPQYALGTKLLFNDGVYQYVKAAGAITQYDLVKIQNDFTIVSGTTTVLPSTEPAKVGVSNQSALLTDECAWIFVGPGLVTVNVAASCVQNVKLYTTAVAGVVDDSATTLINGLKLITTITLAAASPCIAECELGTVLA